MLSDVRTEKRNLSRTSAFVSSHVRDLLKDTRERAPSDSSDSRESGLSLASSSCLSALRGITSSGSDGNDFFVVFIKYEAPRLVSLRWRCFCFWAE